MGSRARHCWIALVTGLALLTSSCAYYNTFYLAKRYFMKATAGQPYPIDKPDASQSANYQKAADLSSKVVTDYSKSKWADDAYLMWARSLLGRDDPLKAVAMLQEFGTRYPTSPVRNEATFFLGVAYRQSRKYHEALPPLDEFIDKAPNHALAPYAHFERARVLTALNRPAEAAAAATQVIERFPKSELVDDARAIRAEALLASGDTERARQDFKELGLHSRTDEERFSFLLREADCLEAGRDYTGVLSLLNDALAHEQPPAPVVETPGTSSQRPIGPAAAAGSRYGQLKLRIGSANLLAGKTDQALADFRSVLVDYPKSALAAEAQYRIAFAYETVLDDFETARLEYGKVRDQSTSSAFYTQATQRLQSLDRLAKYRGTSGDSLGHRNESGFLLAEQYLFQLGKPDRALEAYQDIVKQRAGTEDAAKALTASAWVLRHKLDRGHEADSLLWKVVREYPATEAQLAARDYLEAAGQEVPADLIKVPESLILPPPPVALTPPPAGPEKIGAPSANIVTAPVRVDSTNVPLHAPRIGPASPVPTAPSAPAAPDSTWVGPAEPRSDRTAAPAPASPAPASRPPSHSPPRGLSPLDDPPRLREGAPRDTSASKP
jgi:TolA-binding protein